MTPEQQQAEAINYEARILHNNLGWPFAEALAVSSLLISEGRRRADDTASAVLVLSTCVTTTQHAAALEANGGTPELAKPVEVFRALVSLFASEARCGYDAAKTSTLARFPELADAARARLINPETL